MDEQESLVVDLVIQWEEAVASGGTANLNDICREHPHLISAVQAKIAALKSLTPVLGAGQENDSTVDKAANGHSENHETTGEVHFVVGRVHARGGLGEIVMANDRKLNRPVAVKRMREHCRRNAGARRRFLREAEITGQLQHPGVAPVYGFARDSTGDPVYAMRFVEGKTLQQAVSDLYAAGSPDSSSRTFRKLLARFVTVCQTIEYAHSHGIIHRDLKPANIMFGAYGETVVLDWGLAKRVARPDDALHESNPIESPDENEATQAGDVLGTPAFMSPEQAVDSSTVSQASDIYSLGAILYVIITGKSPFTKVDRTELLDRVRQSQFPLPRSIEPRIPRALEAVCMKAIARELGQRYASAAALAEDIELWQAGDVPSAYRESLPERLQRWGRRHRTLVFILTAAILTGGVAAGIGAGLLYREQKATASERDRADENYQLADRTATDMLASIIENPRLKEADFQHTRRDLLRQTMPLYEKLVAQKPDNESAQFHQAGTLFLLGQVQHELGEENAALERMTEARNRMESLVRVQPGRPEYAVQLARCEMESGSYIYHLGRLEDAQALLLQARQRLTVLGPTQDSSWHLARTNNNLAMVRHSLGNLTEAANDFRSALEWQSTAPQNSDKRDMHLAFRANTLSNYSILLRDQFDYPASIEALRDAIAIHTELADRHPDLTGFQISLAKAELNLAGTLRDRRQANDDSEALARSGVARYEEACKKLPAVVELRFEYARARDSLANILASLGMVHDAVKLRSEIIEDLRKLLSFYSNQPDFIGELAAVLVHQGSSLMDQEKNTAAARAYEEAIKLWEQVLRAKPNDAQAQIALRQTLNNFGNLQYQTGKLDAAEKLYRQQIDMLREARRAKPDDPFLQEAEAAAWMNIGNVASGRRDFAESLAPFTEGIKLADPLLDRFKRKHTEEVVRNCHWGLADSLMNLHREAEAIPHWESMLRLIQSPKERAPFRIDRALALARTGRTDEAIKAVNEVAEQKFLRGPSLSSAAAVYSLASAKAMNGDVREELQKMAFDSIRAAHSAGGLPRTFPDGDDFAPLRQRQDFPALVAEVKTPPKKK